MSYVDSEIETMKDIVVETTDAFVYDSQKITPEDMYFISQLVEEYYQAKADREFGLEQSCDVAWIFAKELAGHVEENDEFHWLNAYFVADGLYESVRREFIEYESHSWDAEQPTEHIDTFGREVPELSHTDALENFDDVLNEVSHLIDLYVNFEEDDAEGIMNKPQQIAMFIGVLQNRYASEFPYDMIESVVSFELVSALTTITRDDSISNRAVETGLRYVRTWAEHKAKREHKMLCVGTM